MFEGHVVDYSQSLRDAENALRDFVAATLHAQSGEGWIEDCGVSTERLAGWKKKQQEDRNSQRLAGTTEDRLVYYSDFFDLETIIDKRWEHFKDAFGDKRTFLVLLHELGRLRNPEAHCRL